jgi:gluconate 2-dehydrogenase gamma chain
MLDRRELFRRTLLSAAGLSAAGSATAREFPAGFDASKDLARAFWKPAFLDEHQNETLIAFSDQIIPKTDSPGAKEALVNRFIDQLLAAEAPDRQREFLESLAFLDGECMKRYQNAFRYLVPATQIEFLRLVAYPHSLPTWGTEPAGEFPGHAHFVRLKDWISRAYFSSEIGMRTLGWDGPTHGEFEGCTHPEGTHQ